MIDPLSLSAAVLLLAAQTADAPDPEILAISEVDAIECRLEAPLYRQFAFGIEGDEQIAKRRGWKKVSSANSLLLEFELPQPITVAQTYTTQRIAFTGDGILAVLDLADPQVLAARETIANTMDAEPMIAAIVASGQATRAEAEKLIRFRKFLGEQVVQDVIEPATEKDGYGLHTTVARTISNANTHPGKTFYGCAYRLEVLDGNAEPL